MNFEIFIKNKPLHKKEIQISFLEWFIGYSEGDGCFLVSEGKPIFIINQADIEVLHYIRTQLGFGIVSTFNQKGSIYARYTVKKLDHIGYLISIFNGNIHLEKVHKRFTEWVSRYNAKSLQSIQVKQCRKPSEITLESAWIAGFFDAEGGFSSRIGGSKQKNKRLYVETYIDQKFEFETLIQIAKLFKVKSVTFRNKEKSYYRVEIKSKISLEIAVQYFQNYKLQTRKHRAYAIWLKIANLFIKGEHISRMERIENATKHLKEINNDFKRTKSVLVLLNELTEKQNF